MDPWYSPQASPVVYSSNVKFEPIDLSVSGNFAQKVNLESWENHMNQLINPETFYYGGYLEKRFFYVNESLFGKGPQKREYHLGLDIWTPAKTKIVSCYDGELYSFHNNDKHLDYGYTLILKHKIKDIVFYSLYGHLNETSYTVYKLKSEQKIKAGEVIGEIGDNTVNGGWPPHLHFQIMKDMQGHQHDYPGVSSMVELENYKNNCPDPTPILLNAIN